MIAVVFSSICFATTIGAFRVVPKGAKIHVLERRYIPGDLINYTFPFILGLVDFNYDDGRKFLELGVFLAWIFAVTHKSGRSIYNPVLILFGWRLYETKFRFQGGSTEHSGYVLANVPIEAGEIYSQGQVEDVMVVRA